MTDEPAPTPDPNIPPPSPFDPQYSAPIPHRYVLDEPTRKAMFEMAQRPMRFIVLPAMSMSLHYASRDVDMTTTPPNSFTSGAAVVVGFSFNEDQNLAYSNAWVMAPDMAMALSAQLLSVALQVIGDAANGSNGGGHDD